MHARLVRRVAPCRKTIDMMVGIQHPTSYIGATAQHRMRTPPMIDAEKHTTDGKR